jgi:hypothetical protein
MRSARVPCGQAATVGGDPRKSERCAGPGSSAPPGFLRPTTALGRRTFSLLRSPWCSPEQESVPLLRTLVWSPPSERPSPRGCCTDGQYFDQAVWQPGPLWVAVRLRRGFCWRRARYGDERAVIPAGRRLDRVCPVGAALDSPSSFRRSHAYGWPEGQRSWPSSGERSPSRDSPICRLGTPLLLSLHAWPSNRTTVGGAREAIRRLLIGTPVVVNSRRDEAPHRSSAGPFGHHARGADGRAGQGRAQPRERQGEREPTH